MKYKLAKRMKMEDSALERVKDELERVFPELKIEVINWLGEGMDNVAVEVNRDWVFRLAKDRKVGGFGGGLELEALMLPMLAKELKMSIPVPVFVGVQSSGLPVVGAAKIEGMSMKAIWSGLARNKRMVLLEQVAEFINELHRFCVATAMKYGVQAVDVGGRIEQDLRGLERVDDLGSDVRAVLERMAGGYLGERFNTEYSPTLLHADLWMEHVLVNEGGDRVNGIIDFGDMVVGDADYELMQIWSELNEDEFDAWVELMPDYAHKDREFFKKKLKFWSVWNVAEDCLFYCEGGGGDGCRRAIGELEMRMGKASVV